MNNVMVKIAMLVNIRVLLLIICVTFFTPLTLANKACVALSTLKLNDTVVTSAEWITPSSNIGKTLKNKVAINTQQLGFGTINILDTQAISFSEPFCRLTATIKPTVQSNIKVEVWLPDINSWNGRYLGVGNGGAAGSIFHFALFSGVEKGYATATTDMGTGSKEQYANFDFGIGEPEKRIDWAHRSTHLMTEIAKKVVAHYYQKPAKNSYFFGCSTGGHQALAEAQKYSNDYDGIIAFGPATYRTDIHARFLWASNLNFKNSEGTLLGEDFSLINKSIIQACDGIDGMLDGVIDDPRRCNYNPTLLLCRKGGSNKACLSEGQVKVARQLYKGYESKATGELLISGFIPGSETELPLSRPYHELWGRRGGLLAWSNNIKWIKDGAEFDFDKYVEVLNDDMGGLVNYINPDLSEFRDRGGKLIITHGWADGFIPAQDSINYYESIEKKVGSRSETQKFVRLFMLPGVDHCYGGGPGPGPDRLNILDAVTSWVEDNRAPESIIAVKFEGDASVQKPIRSRPVCPYPQVARWGGFGDINDAKNYECVNPR